MDKPEIAKRLEEMWGDKAAVYWNEAGFVVVSENGYISEFSASGETFSYGFLSAIPETTPP